MPGLILTFKNYRYDRGIFGGACVGGLEKFRYLFISGTGILITRNTFLYITSRLFANLRFGDVWACLVFDIYV
jgi:putative aldouronate transport system permease protein